MTALDVVRCPLCAHRVHGPGPCDGRIAGHKCSCWPEVFTTEAMRIRYRAAVMKSMYGPAIRDVYVRTMKSPHVGVWSRDWAYLGRMGVDGIEHHTNEGYSTSAARSSLYANRQIGEIRDYMTFGDPRRDPGANPSYGYRRDIAFTITPPTATERDEWHRTHKAWLDAWPVTVDPPARPRGYRFRHLVVAFAVFYAIVIVAAIVLGYL